MHLKSFLIGLVAGIVISTVGLSGIFRILDRGVDTVKSTSHELAR